MKFWSEFKEFAVKGNMIDMAVGIIIGAAFSKIVDSLVRFVITPPLSLLTGKVHLTNLKWVLRPEIKAADGTIIREELVLQYGMFLQATIDFFIISMTIFLLIKTINTMRKKAEDAKDEDRKSTRLNSSHVANSYAVLCLKKKKKNTNK